MAPAERTTARSPQAGRLLGVDLDNVSFLPKLRRTRFAPGTVVDELIEVKDATAQKLLRSIVHLVADIPADSPPDVVWESGRNELLVTTDRVKLSCTSGVVTIGVRVHCDQIDAPTEVTVPIGVGTRDHPRGLVMSTFFRPLGPAAVVEPWADALVGFAWECLLELARKLCAEVGSDGQGRPLIPVDVGAAPKLLLIRAMARHDANIGSLG
jgi:hypothetical protein